MKNSRLPTLAAEEIMKATGGNLIQGSGCHVFNGVSTDSRNITGDTLFIPVVGDRYDGHDFIEEALRSGASGLLLQRGKEKAVEEVSGDVPVICVDDTLKALGDIAHFQRDRFKIPVVAVTGSSGKTTTKEMIASIAGLSMNILKSPGNFNNLIGLPLTLLKMNSDHEVVILEMGTNRRGEIARLTEIARPDIGVITNIGPAHLEGLKSLDGIREEKGDLFANMEAGAVAIINCDDEAVRMVAKQGKGKSIIFGMKKDAFVRAENIIKRGKEGVSFTLVMGKFKRKIDMSTFGEHNIYNALAAAACSLALGIDYDLICEGLTSFRQIDGRMDLHRLKSGVYLIDDSYNANPASVREALKSLRELKGTNESMVILGDMLELGDQSEEIHEDVGRYLADTGVDKVFLRGRFSHAVAAGATKGGLKIDQIFFIDNPGKMAVCLKSCLKEGDWVLIKGSRKMKMEDVTRAIIETFGEETVEESNFEF